MSDSEWVVDGASARRRRTLTGENFLVSCIDGHLYAVVEVEPGPECQGQYAEASIPVETLAAVLLGAGYRIESLDEVQAAAVERDRREERHEARIRNDERERWATWCEAQARQARHVADASPRGAFAGAQARGAAFQDTAIEIRGAMREAVREWAKTKGDP